MGNDLDRLSAHGVGVDTVYGDGFVGDSVSGEGDDSIAGGGGDDSISACADEIAGDFTLDAAFAPSDAVASR